MSADAPWTIARLLEWTTGHLQGKGFASPRLEAQVLLAHALGCTRTALYTRHDEIPADDVRTQFRALLRRRLDGTPVAHLVGRKEFFSLEFEVGPAVLIPRPDSEWLVTECLKLIKPLTAPRVLDVGTGSGCLAIAVAHQNKKAQVTAVDFSADALAVARRNADRHKVADRIRFVESDLFAAIPGEQFDAIVSNPPYIPTADIAGLAVEVRDHDPRLALDGGADGFAIIDRLILAAPEHLTSGGHLLIEIGHDQEAGARERLERAGGWEPGKTLRDNGGHARVVQARRQ